MNPGQRYAHLHLGNLAQLAGAGLGCYGIYLIAGLGVALLIAGIALVALANLEWDGSVIRVPVPTHRPAWQKGRLRERVALRLKWVTRLRLPGKGPA